MKFFKINRLLLLLFVIFFSKIDANAPHTGTPGAPNPPDLPGSGGVGVNTGTPGAQSKTPIDTYVLGLGAVAILFAAGYSRRYYHSK